MSRPNPVAYVGIAVLILTWAALAFSGSYTTVDPVSPEVLYVETSWWGLRSEERVIKWMSNPEYRSPAWMTRGRDGKWHPFIRENLPTDTPNDTRY